MSSAQKHPGSPRSADAEKLMAAGGRISPRHKEDARSNEKVIFVPGRVCLFGEHTDWAGGFRRFNSDIVPGANIVVGTNQGLFATIKKHPNSLVISSCTDTGETFGPFSIPMRKADLLAAARKGDFFSYVAGVAYKILTDYQVSGVEINNFKTDLPTCKGLSSSAAVCVLTARAFNVMYDLKMTIRGEMEYAYQGEILTPSQCGRMDQGCAYGGRPILMKYDGEFLDVEELPTSATPLFYVLVDLQGTKSTTHILQGLQDGYPNPSTEVHRGVHELLGPINAKICTQASAALTRGDGPELGRLMNEAQKEFDRLAQPACPSQLTMPLLHKVMSYPALQEHVWGIKGVGSQGDGTGQLLCKSKADQDAVTKILQEELGMPSITLCLSSGLDLKKAIIPAAGFGPMNFPATLPVRAELFPLIDDSSGHLKPIILYNVEALVDAGIQDIYIIVQKAELHQFEKLFKDTLSPSDLAKLDPSNQEYAQRISKIGERVHFITQETQEGFGHAVWSAKDLIGDEPFLLMLGDHVYRSTSTDSKSCTRQMIDAYKQNQKSVLGVHRTPIKQVSRFGAVSGVFMRDSPGDDGMGSDGHDHQLVDVKSLAEKPTIEYAKRQLSVPGLPPDEVLTMFGQYILTPKVFEYLDDAIANNVRHGGTFQLTPALDKLRAEEGLLALLVQGERFDIGSPAAYLQTLAAFAAAVPGPYPKAKP